MRVTFAHIHGDHRPGDVVDYPTAEARQLVYDGIAVVTPAEPETVEPGTELDENGAAGTDPETGPATAGTDPETGPVTDPDTTSTVDPDADADTDPDTEKPKASRRRGTAATEEKTA